MQKRLTFILLFLIVSRLLSYCQEKISFQQADSLTYRNYLDKNWHDLLKNGKMSLKAGYDYYYLRMRLGIAYYENNHFRKSARQFEKALEWNAEDPIAQEYLYYAYLWGGRSSDAYYFSNRLSAQASEKIGLSGSAVRSLGVYGSYNFMNDRQLISLFPGNTVSLPYGSQKLTQNYKQFEVDMSHRLSDRVLAYHQLHLLNLSNLSYIQNTDNTLLNKDDRVLQLEYYLGLNVLAGKGFIIAPSLHYLYISITNYESTASTGMGRWSGSQNKIALNQYVASLGLYKDIRNFNLGISGSYSNLNQLKQAQQTFSLTCYPLGNLNLYESTDITHHTEYPDNGVSKDKFIFRQKLGFRISDHLWMELQGYLGGLSNYNAGNGSIVFNSQDHTKWLAGGSFIIPFGKKNAQFILKYSYLQNESYFFPDDTTLPLYNNILFSSNLITGGIKWNF